MKGLCGLQKKNKATLALLISALGFTGTLPAAAAGGFGWGLVHHGFLAAVIGGLADWFAVTALFRKPLGIGYRTEILRRNRARIMDSIVEFSSEDLLSVENIMQVVRRENSAELLVDYLEHRGGRERVQELVDTVLLQTVNSMDSRRMAESLTPAVREALSGVALERVVTDILSLLAEEKHGRQVLMTLLDIGRQVLDASAIQKALLENIRILRSAYEGESAGRAFVLAALDLSDERIRDIFNERLTAYLEELRAGDTEAYASLEAGFASLMKRLAQEPEIAELFHGWQEHYLQKMDIGGYLADWLEHKVKGKHPFWLSQIHLFLKRHIDAFVESAEMQAQFDRFVKDFLEEELRKHHNLIPGLIRERLDEMDDDALTDFVEGKVADDLQMIRINGSVVGALVGMGLYLIVWGLERMWGL